LLSCWMTFLSPFIAASSRVSAAFQIDDL
jgi:hypothetical protein